MPTPEASQEQHSGLKQTFLRFLPERVGAIEETWVDITSKDWDNARLQSLLQRIRDLTEFANKFNCTGVQENLSLVMQGFRTLLEARQNPTTHQIEQINSLIYRLKVLCGGDEAILGEYHSEIEEQQPQVFYLCSSSRTLVPRLAAALGELRYSLTNFTKLAELVDKLSQNTPVALVIDANFLPEAVSVLSLDAKKTTPLSLVVVSTTGNLEIRLSALRAGAKAFFVTPIDPQLIATKIRNLIAPVSEPAYRVLIMDDDKSQAEFAGAILRKGGCDIRTNIDPLQLLDAVDGFGPDLILMDLYMPGVDGLELTQIIREQSNFANIPIVFMSGEQDASKQLDAISIGGDDFITKPVRPRNLLTVVKNRIRRVRSLQSQTNTPYERDPLTGLFNRSYLFKQANIILTKGQQESLFYGLICLEVDNWANIQNASSVSSDAILIAIGAIILAKLEPNDLCARIDSSCFAVLASRSTEADLKNLGEMLVQSVAQKPLPIDNITIQPTVSAGLCLFRSAPEAISIIEQRAIGACNLAYQKGGNRLAVQVDIIKKTDSSESSKSPDILELAQQALRNNSLQTILHPFACTYDQQRELYEIQWKVPISTGGYLLAADVLAVAKQVIGLSRSLDRWMLGRALEILREHRQSGRQAWLLIHQTVETIADPQFVAWLRDELRRRLLVGTGLILEFNLADIVTDAKGTRAMVGELGVMGVEVCLGRFSHNEASYKVLKYLSCPYVKISDKLLGAEPDMVKALLEHAHGVGAKLIVPHVQDHHTISKAWLSNADFVQNKAL